MIHPFHIEKTKKIRWPKVSKTVTTFFMTHEQFSVQICARIFCHGFLLRSKFWGNFWTISMKICVWGAKCKYLNMLQKKKVLWIFKCPNLVHEFCADPNLSVLTTFSKCSGASIHLCSNRMFYIVQSSSFPNQAPLAFPCRKWTENPLRFLRLPCPKNRRVKK